MIRRQWAGVWVLAVWALVAAAGPASAQVNTGTVLGTVKDAQGGVIPGATVVLVSEAQGHAVRAGRDQRDRRLRLRERHGRTPTPSRSASNRSRR